MNIIIGSDGKITMIAHEDFSGLIEQGENVNKRRASHVEPVNVALRVLFRVLRWMTGETGRISEWTRTWPCLWRVNLAPSRGPVQQPFADRAEAIRWEVQWLETNRFGGKA